MGRIWFFLFAAALLCITIQARLEFPAPVEHPEWRTSEMLQDVVSRRKSHLDSKPFKLDYSAHKLIQFVDTSGEILLHLQFKPDSTNTELVRGSFPAAPVGNEFDELEIEAMAMLNATEYAETLASGAPPVLAPLDVQEIHRRITGIYDDEVDAEWLHQFAEELNEALARIHGIEDAEAKALVTFQLAAWCLKEMETRRPFVDGNGRVGEVLSAVVLARVVPFPQRTRSRFPQSIYYDDPPRVIKTRGLHPPNTPLAELAAYNIYSAWKSTISYNFEFEKMCRGEDGIWRFPSEPATKPLGLLSRIVKYFYY